MSSLETRVGRSCYKGWEIYLGTQIVCTAVHMTGISVATLVKNIIVKITNPFLQL